MVDTGIGLLNEAAETIGGNDDFFDGVAHFAKKNKTDEEIARIEEKVEDSKAIGKIVRGTLKYGTLALGLAVALKYLFKK
jgi:hypothetical protein